MTAIRSVRSHEGKFVQIANGAAQDRRLSLKARGILLFVLSLPPGQHFTAEWLEAQVREGRESVRSGLKELERYGYFHRSKQQDGRGHWVWDQVISDAPMTEQPPEMSIIGFPADGKPPDGSPSDKDLNTEQPKDEDRKMAPSSRGRASSAAATRTVDQVVTDMREAIANVCGQDEADVLGDGEILGLYFAKANPKGGARDLVAYMSKILEDAHCDVDVLLAGSEAICIPCWRYESGCQCSAKSAA